MKSSDNDFFDSLSIRHLIGNRNTCLRDWREDNRRYVFHKFYYFLGGEGHIRTEDALFHPRAGDLCFIPAGTVHSHWQDRDRPVVQYWTHFETVLPEGRRFRYHRDAFLCRPDRERTERAFSFVLTSPSDPFFPLKSRISLMELLMIFLEEVEPSLVLRSDRTSPVQRVNRYIADHIGEDIRLADLADVAHLHPNYFVSAFKKSCGSTPMEYVNSLRLREADRLLRENRDMTISEAASRVGFGDYRYFSRLYKRRFGMLPSRMRASLPGGKG